MTWPRNLTTNSVPRMVEDLVGGADLLDPPGVHHQHAVGQFEGLVLVVGDEDAGQMDFVVQPPQPLPQLLADLGVQGPERLVQQQHLRLDGQRPGQGHPLPLPAGKLVRIAVGVMLQLHELQQPHHLVLDEVSRRALLPRPHLQPEGHVLKDRHVAKQGVMLKDEADLSVGRVASADVSRWKRIGPLPGSGCSRPAMIRSRVVLPEPDGPSSATSSPVATVRLTSRKAAKPSNVLLIRCTSMLIVSLWVPPGEG